jgi:hypothetical protein
MRIPSDDGGYLELQRSRKAYHVHVIVAARSPDNPLKLVVNTSEVKLSQLLEAVKSVSGPLMLQEKENGQSNSVQEKTTEIENSKGSEGASKEPENKEDSTSSRSDSST